MEKILTKIQYSARQLQTIAASYSVMNKDLDNNLLKPIRLAYLPYFCSLSFFEQLQKSHLVWQKLVCSFANDKKEINRVFQPIAQKDIMVSQLLKLYNEAEQRGINKSYVNWVRTDYFEDVHTHQPKLVQYNLIAASAQGLSQRYYQARKLYENFLFDKNGVKLNQGDSILQNNKPLDLYINMVDKVLKKRNKKGIILMIVHKYPEANIFDQAIHKIEYIKRGYKIIQVCFEEIFAKAKLGQDRILFYQDQEVACVYYRTGYRPKDFQSSTGRDQCYQAKRILELSDTLKLPSVKIQLANFKRAQVQLSKPQVYKRYLNKIECEILQKTLMKSFDFDQSKNFQEALKYIQQVGEDKFFLKPNRQGGLNNISGPEAYNRLITMAPEQRKQWILMKKIQPVVTKNIFVGGIKQDAVVQQDSVSQLGQFGYIIIENDEIVEQCAHGYLIRTKPVDETEGGIMTGVGSLGVIHTFPEEKYQEFI